MTAAPLRVLLLSRYGRLGASSRVRSLQHLDGLAARGIDVDVAPLFDDEYVARLYRGRGQRWDAVAAAYAARLARLGALGRYDVLWVEKELFPYWPAWADRLLSRRSSARAPRLVLDYDDALFHRYDGHRRALVRWLLGRKIDRLMRSADLVLVGNDYLAERARAAGARCVEPLPTVVDTARYTVPPAGTASRPVTIGWIGTPSTAAYLEPLAATFDAVAARTGARLRLIGAGPAALPGVRGVERVAWSEATEVDELKRCDVGIMPLSDEPFERGKCGYKLVQFMACGRPVVASPVGVNPVVVDHGRCGLLAADPVAWRDALIRLATDAELRARLGAAGRERVERHYALHAATERLASLLRAVATRSEARDPERAFDPARTASSVSVP